MKLSHTNFKISDSGLNDQWLFLGASPDGKVSCEGVCGLHHKGENIELATEDKFFA